MGNYVLLDEEKLPPSMVSMKIGVFDPDDGSLIGEFESYSQCCRSLFRGISTSKIKLCCGRMKKNGKPRTTYSPILDKRVYIKPLS